MVMSVNVAKRMSLVRKVSQPASTAAARWSESPSLKPNVARTTVARSNTAVVMGTRLASGRAKNASKFASVVGSPNWIGLIRHSSRLKSLNAPMSPAKRIADRRATARRLNGLRYRAGSSRSYCRSKSASRCLPPLAFFIGFTQHLVDLIRCVQPFQMGVHLLLIHERISGSFALCPDPL